MYTPSRPLLKHAVASVAMAWAVLLAGCAVGPPQRSAAAPQAALPPSGSGVLASVENQWRAAHGDDASGFMLLDRNADALAWRVALIDAAHTSLDLQYYVWFGDRVGSRLMAHVIRAAERWVKVRVLFDDLSTLLRDAGHLQARDAVLACVDAHPNIEIRSFNPWQSRDLLGRVGEGLWDFERLNRRMHNKQMIVDNRAAVIGGRNVADEYFGLNTEFNFQDLDVLGVGPVARQASTVFDRYWNSPWVGRPLRAQARQPGSGCALEAIDAGGFLAQTRLPLVGGPRAVDTVGTQLLPGRSEVHTDSPSRADGQHNHMPDAFRALLLRAGREVLLTNAYIIPDQRFIDDLRDLTARGVDVRILTNSLASHDVPAVNSHYETWRVPIVRTGAQLHEMRHDAALQADVVDTAPVSSGFSGLHTKAMVIDRRHAFIGSMNLDPRSQLINSEMGVLIDSPQLAEALARDMFRGFAPANSWHVTLDADGQPRWRSDRGELQQQPARDLWQRVSNWVFKLFPPSLY